MNTTKLIAASSILTLGVACTKEEVKQPNIVLMFVDDLGWADLGYQNPKFHTPNIDKLKDEGLYFKRTYIPTPTSSPSRTSLLTGKEALRCGLVRHIYETQGAEESHEEFQILESDPAQMKSRSWLPLQEITYAERLRELGYYNFHVGKWHLGGGDYVPTNQGFDATYGTCENGSPNSYYQPFFAYRNPFPDADTTDYLTDLLTDGAVEFIENYDKEQPYLLNFWYYTVHSPMCGRKDYMEYYLAQGMSELDAHYASMVRSMDESVGRVLDAVERSGDKDNTMVIFLSDQGGGFQNGNLRGGKEGGDALAEGGARVPMIIYYPGMEAMGRTYQKPVSSIDIYPTLLEIAQGRPCEDNWINGESLLPVLKGGEQEARSIFMYRSYEDQNSSIVKGDWKLIKYRSGKLELYNLAEDCSEQNNLAGSDTARRDAMLQELLDWEADATPEYLL